MKTFNYNLEINRKKAKVCGNISVVEAGLMWVIKATDDDNNNFICYTDDAAIYDNLDNEQSEYLRSMAKRHLQRILEDSNVWDESK